MFVIYRFRFRTSWWAQEPESKSKYKEFVVPLKVEWETQCEFFEIDWLVSFELVYFWSLKRPSLCLRLERQLTDVDLQVRFSDSQFIAVGVCSATKKITMRSLSEGTRVSSPGPKCLWRAVNSFEYLKLLIRYRFRLRSCTTYTTRIPRAVTMSLWCYASTV